MTTALADSAARRWLGSRRESGGLRDRGSRRRSVPHLLLGLLLVVTCALGVTVGVLSMSDRLPVLVLARPVHVGQLLAQPDVRTVAVWVDSSVDVVPAARTTEILGRPAAIPLPAGAVLPWAALGSARVPPDGQAVTAIAVKPGGYPPQVARGARVWVIAGDQSPELGRSVSTGGPWAALVTGVDHLGVGEAVTVLSLQLPDSAAQEVAALPDGATRVVLRDGGG